MAKKKIEMTAISFRLPVKLKADIEDLAASASQDVSSILIELIGNLVAANKQRIEDFRKASAMPIIKPTFAAPPSPKKSARASKKNPAAQVSPPTPPTVVTVTLHGGASDGDEVKGSGDNEKDS